jgi:teichoic acid transport system permease protein
MALARAVSSVPDVQNLLAFGLRLWLYMSGVFYDAAARAQGTPVEPLVQANPLHAFLTISRDLMLYGRDPEPALVLCAVAWTVVAVVVGWVVFWFGEESYGRE